MQTDLEAVQSPEELWRYIEHNKDRDWYDASVAYWDRQEATFNGVLGGYGHVSEPDISESRRFLLKAVAGPLQEAAAGQRKLIAIDCGAGVGRVTEKLLLHVFDEVDLLEPSEHLLATAQKRCSSSACAAAGIPPGHRLGQILCMGLQAWTPALQRYDVIWIQWALLYLTDDDAIALFQRCRQGLRPDGVIFVKENICPAEQKFVVDKEDRSLTRSHAYMQQLFARANMQLKYSSQQRNFPKELFAVHMYALQPRT